MGEPNKSFFHMDFDNIELTPHIIQSNIVHFMDIICAIGPLRFVIHLV